MSDMVIPVGEGNEEKVFTGDIVKIQVGGSSEKRCSLWDAQFHSVENLKRMRTMGNHGRNYIKKVWNPSGGRIL